VLNVDDQILPALSKNAGKNQISEYAEGYNEEEAKDGEPIAADKRAIAEPLIDVFGEQIVRKVFSKTWNLREEGLALLEDKMLVQ
jgi:hypothetical protein